MGGHFIIRTTTSKEGKCTAGRWPCCSGTLPQVAADYRINTYFRDGRGVYVNLYIPSTLRWVQGGAQIELTQKSEYPYDSQVEFEVKASKPVEFAVNLRIPAWAEGASLAVNGKREPVQPGVLRACSGSGSRATASSLSFR